MNKDELKVVASEKSTQLPDSYQSPYSGSSDSVAEGVQLHGWAKFTDGFRRNKSSEHAGKQLEKKLTLRNLVLMSMVTGIGTGLLVGTGKILHNGGPLLVVLGYAIAGTFVYCTLQAAGELAVAYPHLSGGYNVYPRRFISDPFAFATSWLYCIQWLCVIALECVTGAMTIAYWTDINPDAWVAIIFSVILLINFFGAKMYGEAEFVIGMTKIAMLVGFIIMGICVDVGANPRHEFIGGRYWHNPGAATSFKGFLAVFVTAAFAYGQTEYIALAVAESSNPKALPVACKMVVYKILILFIGSLIMVGLLVPYDNDRLMGGSGSNASPYVLSAALHGVRVVPHLINAVILMSVTSVGSSALYCSSRTLQALSEQGYAPAWFNYIDKTGRPLRALCVCSIIGIFSFIAAYEKQEEVFTWLLSISGLSQVITWGAIVGSHIRFRAALKYNGVPLESLGYVASTGLWGSWYALIWFILVIIAQFYVALFPFYIGGEPNVDGKPDAEAFFQGYLSAPIWIAFYFIRMIWKRDWRLFLRVSEIDLDTQREIYDPDIIALEKQEEAQKVKSSFAYRVRKFFFW
ncbi:leu/Val/Ile amino-acid permease [Diutina catenulata]